MIKYAIENLLMEGDVGLETWREFSEVDTFLSTYPYESGLIYENDNTEQLEEDLFEEYEIERKHALRMMALELSQDM